MIYCYQPTIGGEGKKKEKKVDVKSNMHCAYFSSPRVPFLFILLAISRWGTREQQRHIGKDFASALNGLRR